MQNMRMVLLLLLFFINLYQLLTVFSMKNLFFHRWKFSSLLFIIFLCSKNWFLWAQKVPSLAPIYSIDDIRLSRLTPHTPLYPLDSPKPTKKLSHKSLYVFTAPHPKNANKILILERKQDGTFRTLYWTQTRYAEMISTKRGMTELFDSQIENDRLEFYKAHSLEDLTTTLPQALQLEKNKTTSYFFSIGSLFSRVVISGEEMSILGLTSQFSFPFYSFLWGEIGMSYQYHHAYQKDFLPSKSRNGMSSLWIHNAILGSVNWGDWLEFQIQAGLRFQVWNHIYNSSSHSSLDLHLARTPRSLSKDMQYSPYWLGWRWLLPWIRQYGRATIGVSWSQVKLDVHQHQWTATLGWLW
jgi:hypothetical protein